MNKMNVIGMMLAALVSDVVAGEAIPTVNFTVADARPEESKKQKILSLSITSCSYAIQRLGEKKAPGRLDALREDLVHIRGSALEGKQLEVLRYDIFFNNKAVLKGMVYVGHSGIIPEVMKDMGEECPKEKMKGGWFDVAELQHPHSPLIVEMEVTMDGQAHSVRALHAPPHELAGNFKKPEDGAEVRAVMRMAAETLAAKLP
jgi:hypothetical protein